MAGDTPIQLHRHEPDQDILDHLRDLLPRAEAGEVTGLLICYADRTRGVSTALSGSFDRDEVLGVIERMKHRLLRRMEEECYVVDIPHHPPPDDEPDT